MKLRSLLLVAGGVFIGMWASRKLREDDPMVISGPERVPSGSSNPAARAVSRTAQALGDRATVASLDAIRRARGAIRQRLGAQGFDDDVAWN